MVANKKITGRATSLPAGLAIGAVCSLAATLVLTAILAKLVEAETLPVEKVGYGIMVLLIVSSFAGAMISFGRIKRQRMLVCIVSGVIYFAMLMSMTALFFGGSTAPWVRPRCWFWQAAERPHCWDCGRAGEQNVQKSRCPIVNLYKW